MIRSRSHRLASVLTFALALAALQGCGGRNNPTDSGPDPGTDAAGPSCGDGPGVYMLGV